METEFELFVNYGVLTRDKRRTYSYGCPMECTCYDKILVRMPENDYFTVFEDKRGRLFVEDNRGYGYDINDLLHGNERPYLRYDFPNGEYKEIKLEIVKE